MTDHRIRQSEFTTFQRCPRKHHFEYTRGLVRVPEGPRMPLSSHRDSGTAVHKGVEVLHRGGTEAEARAAIDAFVDELRAIRWEGELPELSKVDTKEWWECHRIAHAMLGHYIEWLEEGHDSGFETQFVEHSWEHEIPGTDGLVAYGQIDLAGLDAIVGGAVVEDLKSGAQTPMSVDFQLRTYAWAYKQETGVTPKQAAYRSIKRILGTGNAKRPFVERLPIFINDDILRKHEQILAVRALDIMHVRQYGHDAERPEIYPNPTKDCSWDCDFRSVCPMVDEGDDFEDVLQLNFTVKSDDTES